jgi:hypothetical protein
VGESDTSSCPSSEFAGVLSFADANNRIHWQMFCADATGQVQLIGLRTLPFLDVGESSKLAIGYLNQELVMYEIQQFTLY